MNEIAIRARHLSKVYRLYAKPHYRFLDMIGLLSRRPGAYTEHFALDDVSLDIRRGEKVAVIGRNGAGKSTLLKLITQVIEPTSGELVVSGKVHALLQIGTGFHPDFSGRENVYAYLAQLGVTGAEARRRCAEIVEFAELEAYIDQPVKTYSTGMGVRLMFATSTAITPDLLVLDEVLGVGDAYFAHKSYERTRELCDSAGTTLLLVTHDIYSAVNLCPRIIWIDGGRVLMDGDGPAVVTAYEDSIRQQEEQRLRRRKEQRLKALDDANPGAAAPSPHVLLEVLARNNVPQPSPVYFSRLSLVVGDEVVADLPLTDAAGGDKAGPHLEFEGGCWGPQANWQGRPSRPMLNYGSTFHKVVAVFPGAPDRVGDYRIRAEYWSDAACDIVLRCFINGREFSLGALPPVERAWAHHQVAIDPDMAAVTDLTTTLSLTGRQGTGAIVVENVRTLNAAGEDTHFFRHGDAFTMLMPYEIHQPGLAEHAQVLVAIHRDGVLDTCRIHTRQLYFDHARRPCGQIRLHLPRLYLANGTYTLTVMVAQEGYYDRRQTKYFSLNPEVYTCLSRVTEIVVTEGGIIGSGTGVVGTGEWGIEDGEAAPVRPGRTAVEVHSRKAEQ
jgi:ABC-type polysaccharide/polyol phosphate transport system ATPase subunit